MSWIVRRRAAGHIHEALCRTDAPRIHSSTPVLPFASLQHQYPNILLLFSSSSSPARCHACGHGRMRDLGVAEMSLYTINSIVSAAVQFL